jgi:hypothetical protein
VDKTRLFGSYLYRQTIGGDMYYFGDALTEIKKIKGLPDGHLDYSTLPPFARKTIVLKEDRGEKDKDDKPVLTETCEDGRDLGAMISMLTVAVQQLTERVEKLEKP